MGYRIVPKDVEFGYHLFVLVRTMSVNCGI